VSEAHGRNSRLDEIQAAILRVQLGGSMTKTPDEVHRQQYLAGIEEGSSRCPSWLKPTHCWSQFVVRTPKREELKTHLEKQGILCGVLIRADP